MCKFSSMLPFVVGLQPARFTTVIASKRYFFIARIVTSNQNEIARYALDYWYCAPCTQDCATLETYVLFHFAIVSATATNAFTGNSS